MTNRLGMQMSAAAAATTLLLGCSFLGTKVDGGPAFLAAAGFAVLAICALAERVLPPRRSWGQGVTLIEGSVRGGIVGVLGWLAMMFGITLLMEVGDKFLHFAASWFPFAGAFGVVAGLLVRLATRWLRHTTLI